MSAYAERLEALAAEAADRCTSCGKCVHVCPTGALFEKSKVGSKTRKNPDFLPYLNMMRDERQ